MMVPKIAVLSQLSYNIKLGDSLLSLSSKTDFNRVSGSFEIIDDIWYSITYLHRVMLFWLCQLASSILGF